MPLSYGFAYGGKAANDYGPLPFVNNPIGKGYYLKKEDAVNSPLPNIEDPNNRVNSWKDTPDPVGFSYYPLDWGLRLFKAVTINEETKQASIHGDKGFFNKAHPSLSQLEVSEKDVIRIAGMSSNDFHFNVPECPIKLYVELGEKSHVLDFNLEEIEINMIGNYVDLSYRRIFDYKFVRHQKRKTVLKYK